MTTKLLQWLFSPRASLGYDEHEDDDWNELARRGYAALHSSTRKNRYCFTDCGVIASSWFTCESFEEMQRIRRRWAKEELERVLRIEKMESE